MEIKIIPEKCIACGLCHLYAPDIFDYDDAGIVKFDNSSELTKNFDEVHENLTKAVKSCPIGALVKSDDNYDNSNIFSEKN